MIILLAQEKKFQRKFCQESSNLPFAVPGNVKLKLPNKALENIFLSNKKTLVETIFLEETGRDVRENNKISHNNV
jgi:hypothetical protein